jgi:uncharacterized membrane protein YfcA
MHSWLSFDTEVSVLISMALFAFCAGFVDAVVGGGGLIQMPALLINFPHTSIPSIVGTSKVAGFTGTTIAAIKYAKKIKIDLIFILSLSFVTLFSAMLGSKVLTQIDTKTFKPFILGILIIIAIYTFVKKDLGNVVIKSNISKRLKWTFGLGLALIIGFYDGIFGPGTGSFLVFGFVMLLNYEFLKASAYAKIVNCVSNIGSLIYLVPNGFYLLEVAIVMAILNGIGSFVGANYAIAKGNVFVRKVFLFIVIIMIIRYGYDVFGYLF